MNSENRRLLLATTVSIAIFVGWSYLQARHAPPPAPSGTAAQNAPAPEAPAPAPSAATPAAAPVAPVPAEPERTVVLETQKIRATFSTLGGALKRLELLEPKFRNQEHGGAVPMNLVKVKDGQAFPNALVPSKELGGTGEIASDPAARASMRVVAHSPQSVTFEGRVGTAEVRKTFTVRGDQYGLALDLQVTAPGKGELYLIYPGYISPDAPKPSGFLGAGAPVEKVEPLCRIGDKKPERFDEKQAVQDVPGAAGWAGVDENYFLSAVIPATPLGGCIFYRGPDAGERAVALRLPVDGKLSASFKLFDGPKRVDLLQAEGHGLEAAINYGAVANLFAVFARALLWLMRHLFEFVKSWGVSIILLTFLVKLALYPLTAKSMQSMNEMRKLQPEIEKLKAKLGDDKEKLNLAVMQLYQQHKVNPLGGCLPMLIQMPIWFALYATLQTSVELYHEPFLWLPDLTVKDPYYILPLAMGASSFLMQKLSPQPADNAQAKMLLYFMPILFTFMMFWLPSGLTLYILVNNVLSIAQQQWLMRRQAKPAVAA